MTTQQHTRLTVPTNVDWTEALVSAGVPRDFVTVVAGTPKGPCPICGGNTRYSFTNKYGRGDWYCHNCQKGDDGIGLVRAMYSLSFPAAYRRIFGDDEKKPLYPVNTGRQPAAVRKLTPVDTLKRVFLAAAPLSGECLGSAYLRYRVPGVDVLRLRDIRFIGAREYRMKGQSHGRHPCLVTIVRGPDGKVFGLHFIYLDPDLNPLMKGKNRVVPETKVSWKCVENMRGGGVYVHGVHAHMAVAEGLETGLGVHMLRGLPLVATLTASLMAGLELPKAVACAEFHADYDEVNAKTGRSPGVNAMVTASARARANGVTVLQHRPASKDEDYADIWIRTIQQRNRT